MAGCWAGRVPEESCSGCAEPATSSSQGLLLPHSSPTNREERHLDLRTKTEFLGELSKALIQSCMLLWLALRI